MDLGSNLTFSKKGKPEKKIETQKPKKIDPEDDEFYDSRDQRVHNAYPSNSNPVHVNPNTGMIKHHPQIIDRDTEIFKNRLETMLNNFKIDTLTEYMEAKKHLLEEQGSII